MTEEIDFTQVPDQQEFKIIEKGTYEATVFAIEKAEGQNSGKAYLKWTFKIQQEPYKNRNVWLNTSLQPQSLWVLANLLESAFGMDVKNKKLKIDKILNLVGSPCKVVITHRQYEGQQQEQVSAVLKSNIKYDEVDIPF